MVVTGSCQPAAYNPYKGISARWCGFCHSPPSRLWVRSWLRRGTTARRHRTTCCTLRTSGQAETSTKPCARSARATPSSASMNLSPCELDWRLRQDLSTHTPREEQTCCHHRDFYKTEEKNWPLGSVGSALPKLCLTVVSQSRCYVLLEPLPRPQFQWSTVWHITTPRTLDG